MANFRIGISGWTYAPWRGTFYPQRVTQKNELAYAASQLNSIEINGSFYSLQTPKSYQTWYDATPADFVFSVKGGRFITHMKKLRDVEVPLANFLASGVLALRDKLGPILWQFPPQFAFDADRFDAFFQLLPRTTKAAAKLAKRHDAKLEGRAYTKADVDRPIRYAVEVRHDSFKSPEFIALLRRHDVALVVADTAGKWPYMEDVTSSDFVYARLHGDTQLYVSGYTDEALDRWAGKLLAWSTGHDAPNAVLAGPAEKRKRTNPRDVYVYFDNDVKVRSPFDAINLAARLGLNPVSATPEVPAPVMNATARTRWPVAPGRRGKTAR